MRANRTGERAPAVGPAVAPVVAPAFASGRRRLCRLCLLAGLCACLPAVAPSAETAPRKRLVMLDFQLLDDTLDRASDAAQKVRLAKISKALRDAFVEHGFYDVVDNAPAQPMIDDLRGRFRLYDCNGCDVEIGQALHADRVLTAWVQKVSNLILNINIQIRDVHSGNVVLNKSVDIRGNTDASWLHGIHYMVRDMEEKHQGNR
ncbi:MAG: DUF3280 domain-containing protein [Burkholderiaceae bacterium]